MLKQRVENYWRWIRWLARVDDIPGLCLAGWAAFFQAARDAVVRSWVAGPCWTLGATHPNEEVVDSMMSCVSWTWSERYAIGAIATALQFDSALLKPHGIQTST